MPEHKNQHYVPKCHLKPFSLDGAARSIHLFNLKRGLLVKNASLKDQCSHAYFYGDDRLIEKALQPFEGKYAAVVQKVSDEVPLDQGELGFLKNFLHLQYLRTEVAVRRTLLAEAEMGRLVGEGASNAGDFITPSTHEETAQDAIKQFIETLPYIVDLKTRIIRNQTKLPLITSDDPAVQVNRFYVQKLGSFVGGAGLLNSGFSMFMPLSPKYAVCVYDPFVYTCPDRIGDVIHVTNSHDTRALNNLQYLKSAENIYFSDWADGQRIKEEALSAASDRPSSWHRLNYAVLDDSLGGSRGTETYRAVYTREERLGAQIGLIHLQMIMLKPRIWFSPLKFRAKPRFVNTRTGSGYLRPTYA
jgi:hypothetical protein